MITYKIQYKQNNSSVEKEITFDNEPSLQDIDVKIADVIGAVEIIDYIRID